MPTSRWPPPPPASPPSSWRPSACFSAGGSAVASAASPRASAAPGWSPWAPRSCSSTPCLPEALVAARKGRRAISRTMKAAWGSLAVAVLALGLKLGAWWLTGSVALYSDALETIINVFAACGALVALSISAKPPDANHPYGHQKAEYFSAVLEGMMVLGAAGAILHEVYSSWQHLEPLRAPFEGMAVNGLASVLNGVWAACLIRWGRAWRSPAILAS